MKFFATTLPVYFRAGRLFGDHEARVAGRQVFPVFAVPSKTGKDLPTKEILNSLLIVF